MMIRARTMILGSFAVAAFASGALAIAADAPTGQFAANANATNATQATATTAAPLDRDGKKICGYSLMSDSERAGYRSLLFGTKSMEDRDAIREDNCKVMRKRASERGVKLDE